MATKQKRRRKSKTKRQHQRDKEVAGKSVFNRAEAGDYVLTFGKFKGRTLGDVDYNYLAWLRGVETHDLSVKAAQRLARGLSFKRKVGTKRVVRSKARDPKPRSKPTPAAKPKRPSEPKRPGSSYKLRFGKHCGQRLNTVPEDYLIWLRGIGSSSLTVQQDQEAVERYLTPAVSKRGKRRWCGICEREQRGTVCSRCGWDLVESGDNRVEPVAMLVPDEW